MGKTNLAHYMSTSKSRNSVSSWVLSSQSGSIQLNIAGSKGKHILKIKLYLSGWESILDCCRLFVLGVYRKDWDIRKERQKSDTVKPERLLAINPFMPGSTKMYHQRVKNSNFSDFDDTWSLCTKDYKNLLSSLLPDIYGLNFGATKQPLQVGLRLCQIVKMA